MHDILDFVKLDDFLPLLILCLMVLFIAGKIAAPDAAVLRYAKRASAIAFVIFGGIAVYELNPRSVGDIIGVLLRSCMAAGAAYAVTVLGLGLVFAIIADPMGEAKGWWDRVKAHAEHRREQRRDTADRQARDRSERLEQERKRLQSEREAFARAEESVRSEQERLGRIDEARSEVVEFYKNHRADLAESLPEPLFRSKLATGFPVTISPQDAWKSAETLISEMLPLVGMAVSKRREKEEAREKQEAIDREAQEQRNAIARLTEWRNEQRSALQANLPEGTQQVIALQELDDRFDQLMKETIQETKP
jgi:flagellar motility protein MotE (MotC chaperone)